MIEGTVMATLITIVVVLIVIAICLTKRRRTKTSTAHQMHTCQPILTQNRDRIAQKVGSLTENRDIRESWSLQL